MSHVRKIISLSRKSVTDLTFCIWCWYMHMKPLGLHVSMIFHLHSSQHRNNNCIEKMQSKAVLTNSFLHPSLLPQFHCKQLMCKFDLGYHRVWFTTRNNCPDSPSISYRATRDDAIDIIPHSCSCLSTHNKLPAVLLTKPLERIYFTIL